MVHLYRPDFPHRFSANGSFVSICTLCRTAVATAKTEAELAQHERNHKCNRGLPISRIPLRIESRAFLSICESLKTVASRVACSWQIPAANRPGERAVRRETFQADS
jgi:hypothetical protein